jgi:Putative zinc-finger
MDHNQATELTAIERYLLKEMSPQEREEFEEHYFDCQECAIDLRATAAFMDAARKEFQTQLLPRPGTQRGAPVIAPLWSRALVWTALAASLLVIVYQNAVVFPGLKTQIAELRAPEVLPVISLVRGNSRGGTLTASSGVSAGGSALLSLDIPTQDRFSSYTCLLFSPDGKLIGSIPVSAQAAKDTVSIRVSAAGRQAGTYTLQVQGDADHASRVDLSSYSFALNP